MRRSVPKIKTIFVYLPFHNTISLTHFVKLAFRVFYRTKPLKYFHVLLFQTLSDATPIDGLNFHQQDFQNLCK